MPRNSWVQLPVHEVTVGRAALFTSRVCCGVAPITGHYMYAHMRERRYVEGNWRGGKKRRKLEPRGPRLTRGGGALRRRFLLAINAAARFKPRMLPLRTTRKTGKKAAPFDWFALLCKASNFRQQSGVLYEVLRKTCGQTVRESPKRAGRTREK